MQTSYVGGQSLHIRSEDLLRKKNSNFTWNMTVKPNGLN